MQTKISEERWTGRQGFTPCLGTPITPPEGLAGNTEQQGQQGHSGLSEAGVDEDVMHSEHTEDCRCEDCRFWGA